MAESINQKNDSAKYLFIKIDFLVPTACLDELSKRFGGPGTQLVRAAARDHRTDILYAT